MTLGLRRLNLVSRPCYAKHLRRFLILLKGEVFIPNSFGFLKTQRKKEKVHFVTGDILSNYDIDFLN